MNGGAEVVQKAGQREFQRASAASGLGLGFVDINRKSGLGEHDGGGQAVRSCSDDASAPWFRSWSLLHRTSRGCRLLRCWAGLIGALRSQRRLWRPLHHSKLSIRLERQRWSIKPEKFAPPPHSGRSFFGQRRKPILPNDGAHQLWRCIGEGIASEQSQDVSAVRQ